MAIAIKSIPILHTSAAHSFEIKAKANVEKRATVNFSKQLESSCKILRKSKLI